MAEKKSRKKVRYRHTRKKTAGAARSSAGSTGSGTGSRTGAAKMTKPGASRAQSAKSGRTARSTRSKSRRQVIAHRRYRRIRRLILLAGILLIAGVIAIHQNSHHERISQDGYYHDERFRDRLVVDGIDVSWYQGSDVNFKEAKKSGVDFVFIRAGYRTSDQGNLKEDTTFRHNLTKAKEAGMMVGLYLYSQATSKAEAVEEANYLLELAEGSDIDLPLVMDLELYPGGRLDKKIRDGKLTKKKLTNAAIAFCETVEAAGYESGIYSNYEFLEQRLDAEQLGTRTNVWMAHYAESTDYGPDYAIWQCSGSSHVAGISKEVDKDFWYLDPKATYQTLGARNKGARSISRARVEIKKNSLTYIGLNVKPKITVTDGMKPLSEGTDYRLSYLRNNTEGTGYVIVTGLGDYKDAVTCSFEIRDLL